MNAMQNFNKLVRNTDIIQQVVKSLEEEPFNLFIAICKEHTETGKPVPDHRVHLSGYIGEVSLKALIAAKLIEVQKGERMSLYRYVPTEEGLKLYNGLVNGKAG